MAQNTQKKTTVTTKTIVAKPESRTTCSQDGLPLRLLHEHGKGKGAKRQRSKWRTCDNGHKVMVKYR